MRFQLYSELSPAKCASAIQERISQNETSTRPKITGKATKEGFTITVTTAVIRNFNRSTSMKASFERDKGVTVVTGYVNTGANRKQQIGILIGAILVGLALISVGYFIQGVVVVAIGIFMYIPMQGDSQNSEYLLKQIKSALKAKTRDPR